MTIALVTGGAGFLGSRVVRQLVEGGTRVRAMAMPDESLDELEGIDVEIVRGNVLSPDDARRAVEGVDTVFHLAAIYDTIHPATPSAMRDISRMYAVNLRGTFNMLEACRRADVDKVVYTASMVAIGRPAPGEIADEDSVYSDWDIDFAYARAKHLSMLTALDFAAWGLDVRVVCPGLVVGPGDRRPTPSGRLILSVAQGKTPGYTDGGASYVDVRDAAAGHLAAAKSGRAGRVYLVTAHNLSNRDMISTVARVAGRRARVPRIPTTIARLYVNAMAKRAVRRGKRPEIAPIFFEYGLRECFYDNTRAIDELGLSFRPFETTVADALDDYRRRGWL